MERECGLMQGLQCKASGDMVALATPEPPVQWAATGHGIWLDMNHSEKKDFLETRVETYASVPGFAF